MDDAVWLVEYLARTRGADHLKVNSRHLGGGRSIIVKDFKTLSFAGLLAYYSVDVLLILGSALVVFLLCLYNILPHLLRACRSSRKQKEL